MSDEEKSSLVRGGDDGIVERLEQFFGEVFERGPVAEVVLVNVSLHGNSPVGDWTQFEGVGPENLAMQVMERAVDDARVQKGAARYIVTYKRSTDRRTPDGRTFFTLTGQGYDIEGIEDTEGPNGPGLISQLMRHSEASVRVALLSARETISELRRENAELRAQTRHMWNSHYKVIETHEKLINEDHRRQLEMRKARFEESRQEKLFDQIGNLFPILLSLFAEGKSEVLKDTAFKLQIKNLVGSLTEAQIANIVRGLDAPQQIAFLELYKGMAAMEPESISRVVDKKAEKEEAERRAREAEAEAAKGSGKGE